MQVSIKPIYTPNLNKTTVYQNFSANCGIFSFKSGKFDSSLNNDCFIKSPDKRLNENFCVDTNIFECVSPDIDPDSRNPLNENSYEIALNNVDIPITTVDEYREVIDRIGNSKCINGYPFFRFREDLESEYICVGEKELGLLPYVGINDVSSSINEFLSGRLNDLTETKKLADNHELDGLFFGMFLPENYGVMEDIVRALDYSLNKLDDEFGKYDGIVYRTGHMDTGSGQYYSTSLDPTFVSHKMGGHRDGYSVIRVKTGHKIVDFQKKGGSALKDESEILLDRKSKFRQLTIDECDEELLRVREVLADKLFKSKDDISFLSPYTREQLLSLIKVYEET